MDKLMGAIFNWTVNEAFRKSTNVWCDKISTRKFRIVQWITGGVIVIRVWGDKIRPGLGAEQRMQVKM